MPATTTASSSSSGSGLAGRLAALEARLAALEARVSSATAAAAAPAGAAPAGDGAAAAAAAAHAHASSPRDPSVSPTQRRLAESLFAARGYRAPFCFRRVAPDYYSWPLERRAAALSADTPERLCKTIVLRNTKAAAAPPMSVPEGAASEDPLATRHFFVVTQYCRRFHADKLARALHRLYADRGRPCGKQNFNLRLCPEADSAALTGFAHNAVTPVGSATPLCVVLSHHLLELPARRARGPGGGPGGGGCDSPPPPPPPPGMVGEWGAAEEGAGRAGWFWMGGGEVDLKLRVEAAEFVRAYGAVVLDCTYDEIVEVGGEED
jgi:hypothetical protein